MDKVFDVNLNSKNSQSVAYLLCIWKLFQEDKDAGEMLNQKFLKKASDEEYWIYILSFLQVVIITGMLSFKILEETFSINAFEICQKYINLRTEDFS